MGLLVLTWASCRKKDGIEPDITIITPLENTQFDVFDTVHVQFEVTDETQLVSVSVKVLNSDLVPVTATESVQLNGTSFSGSADLIIADKLIETGDYHVLVSASDGLNEQRAFRGIGIAAIPKVRRAMYFADAATPAGIYLVDSLFQGSSPFISAGQDVGRLCVNSLMDRLTLVGHFSTGITSYKLAGGGVAWSDDVFSVAQTPRYMDLACNGNEVFVTIYDREIRSYGHSGSLTMNEPTGVDRPGAIHVSADHIIVEQNPVGTADRFLHVYHAQTRAFLRSAEMPMDVVAMCAFDSDAIMVFGNDGDQARVLQYDVQGNGYWEPRQLPAGKLTAAVQLDGQTYAIAHADGLYSYTYSPNFLNLIRPGTVYQDVRFDVAGNRVVAASSNVLEEISVTGQLLNTVMHTDSITCFDIHYTR